MALPPCCRGISLGERMCPDPDSSTRKPQQLALFLVMMPSDRVVGRAVCCGRSAPPFNSASPLIAADTEPFSE